MTVVTTKQIKNSSLQLFAEIINYKTGRQEDEFSISNTQCWSNKYSDVIGDRRALGGSCSDSGGSKRFLPDARYQWVEAARCMRGNFYRCVKKRIY